MKLTPNDLPEPAVGEVTIEVKTVGLNFADIFAIWRCNYGRYSIWSLHDAFEY